MADFSQSSQNDDTQPLGAARSFWWVNHNQTFENEVGGGYIWSPKEDKNGNTNQTYLNLTRARVDDIVFSFAKGQIQAVGVVTGLYRDTARPVAFGAAGERWDNDGWLVPITWQRLEIPFRPKSEINLIAPLLPTRYSPIQLNGDGNQKFYLTSIGDMLGELLLGLTDFQPGAAFIVDLFERLDRNEETLIESENLPLTVKEQLIKARRGQGLFRYRLLQTEHCCRMTSVPDQAFLIASHIKPWRDSSNDERLDGNNGLLLSPHVDRLFDAGRISFESAGNVICKDEQTKSVMRMWGLNTTQNVGSFNERQKHFLGYHRAKVFCI